MGWSEWITPDLVTWGASPSTTNPHNVTSTHTAFGDGAPATADILPPAQVAASAGTGLYEGGGASFNTYSALQLARTASPYPETWSVQVDLQQSYRAYTMGDAWLAHREWFPALLYDLVENVDYSVIPGRDPSAVDAYVEYESTDPNTPVTMRLNGSAQYKVDSISTGYPVIGVPTDVLTTASTLTGTQWPAGGSLAATLSPPTVADPLDVTVPISVPLDTLIGLPSFSVILRPQTVGGLALPEGWEGQFIAIVNVTGGVGLSFQMPRWRYWGKSFLWNAQRNDGLDGRSAGRGRGTTSTQASTRNRGGIH